MPILLRYKLECSHAARAQVNNQELPSAYRKGMKIQCPQCQYQEKEIVDEQLTEL